MSERSNNRSATNSSFPVQSIYTDWRITYNQQIRENDEQWENANYLTFVKIIPPPTRIKSPPNNSYTTKENECWSSDTDQHGSLSDMHLKLA